MCGIVGYVVSTGKCDLDAMRTACDALTHRGPDSEGVWCDSEQRVVFGHRRLAIIDLSEAGRQPLIASDASVGLVFNGEIYNFSAIRQELLKYGHTFRSHSDTEVLLRAYQHWGDDCWQRLNGMFAAAIYDKHRSCIFLVRDRVGEKPLYYWENGKSFAFASELKALLSFPEVPRRLSAAALQEFLAYGFVGEDRCVLEGLRKLRPGYVLRLDTRTMQTTQRSYWALPAPLPAQICDMKVAVAHIEQLLSASVAGQLVADVPVGVLLSGGIDSSIVAATAARVSRAPIKTFTVTFPDQPKFNEAAHARLVASYIGSEHFEIPASRVGPEIMTTLARQYDEPLGDSSIVPTYIVASAIRKQCAVALGGDGGDELFGGYLHHSEACARESRASVSRCFLFRNAVADRFSAMTAPGLYGRNRLLRSLQSFSQAYSYPATFFDRNFREKISVIKGYGVSPEYRRQEQIRSLSQAYGFLQASTRSDFQNTLVDDYLVKVDRASMLCSLEIRAPFLDHRIVEFAFCSLADDLRATPKQRKCVLRELARQSLPDAFDLRRKQGFSIPLQQWLKGDWGDYFKNVLLDPQTNILERKEVERLFTEQARGYTHNARIFALVMLVLWQREYHVSI